MQRHADIIKHARRVVNRMSYAMDNIHFFQHDLPLEPAHLHYALMSNLKSALYQLDTLQIYLNCYAAMEHICSWRTVPLWGLYDFLQLTGVVNMQSNGTQIFSDAGYWDVCRPWRHTWLTAFHLDSVRGIPCTHPHTHTHTRFHVHCAM